MMNCRALIQLANGYHRLDPKAQAVLEDLRAFGSSPTLEPRTPEDKESLEKLEQWLQTAALEGVDDAEEMARTIRSCLYPRLLPPRPANRQASL